MPDTCYNLGVTSLRDPLDAQRLPRSTEERRRIPPVFIVGVAVLAVVVAGLLLRSVLGASGASAGPGSSPLVAAAPSGSIGPSDPGSSAASASSSGASSAATSTPVASPTFGLTGYVWPLVNPTITLPFGPSPWGEFVVNGQLFHDGVDMATFCGDSVHAAHDGVVLAASRQYDNYMGWIGSLAPYYQLLDAKHWWNSLPIVIVIDDGDGYRSIYAHESKVTVKPGQHVTAGQVIGYEGATGNASGCHVHFGLFSPAETATFALDPGIVKRDLMPKYEIARIDPLLVLPFRCEIEEMRVLRPVEAAPCPLLTTPAPPPPKPTSKPTANPTSPPSEAAAASPTG